MSTDEEAVVASRADVEQAIAYWGAHGSGGVPGCVLPREASLLVDVLATMNWEREDAVTLACTSLRGRLLTEALQRAPSGPGQGAG